MSTAAGRYAGTRVHRVEDARLLTGRGTFVDDVVRPGMLHACFVRSPFARARIAGIDVTAALGAAGRARGVPSPPISTPACASSGTRRWARRCPDTPRPPLAEDEVRFVGDPVALVVAVGPVRRRGRRRPRRGRLRPAAAGRRLRRRAGLRAARARGLPGQRRRHDGRAALRARSRRVFAAAAHVVRETIYQQAYAPVPMETRGIVAEWSGDELTIWAATQAPHEVRMFCARLLGIPEHRVRVIMRDTGGGFGQKVVPLREDMCIMLAAQQLAGRAEVDRGPPREPAGGRPVAPRARRRADGVRRRRVGSSPLASTTSQDVGAYPTPWPVGTAAAVGMLFPGPYRVPTGGVHARRRSSRTPRAGPRTAGRGSSSRWPARCCSTSRRGASASTRSSCAAATCCGATSCRTRTRTA